MWVKFRWTDEDGDECSDRISPITEQIPNPNPDPGPSPDWYFYESPDCAETWANLADLVKPGYYGAWYDEDKGDKGEKNMHSFFFVEWEDDGAPGKGTDGDCLAYFRFIGGNQDGDKITIGGTRHLYNDEEGYSCPTPPDQANETEMVWGSNYNFFGIIRENP